MSDRIEAEILDVLGEEVAAAVDTPLVVIEGSKGDPGKDGITPTIGSNGNWYLGATDTGKPSRGATGAKGDPGTPGTTGPAGAPGKDGHSPVVTATKSGKTTTISVDGAAIATVEDGADGKSAYQYAVEGGYTGTEAEFAAKLAEELPDALPNPNAMTFTGSVTGSYDGSEAMTVNIPSAVTDDHINSLIDAKLGVIENGSY